MDNANKIPSFHLYHSLIDHTDQGIFAFQANSRQFLYLNPAFERVMGLPRESIRAADLPNLVHPEDQAHVREAYQQLLAGESKEKVELRILTPDKSVRWLQVKPFLLREPSGEPLLGGTVEDITEWKDYFEVETRYSNKKNAILQILSHDLAGPLGQIQALSSMVAKDIKGRDEEHLNTVMGMIIETSKRCIRLIRDFLEEEFLESTEMTLLTSRVNVVEMLQPVVEQMRDTHQEHTRTFRFTSSDPSTYADIDEVKFLKVITNLLSNALKFTPDDGVIEVSIEDKPDRVLFRVADNGIGIPEKYHNSLFDKFTKARRPGLRDEPSVGLGMSIIKTIVEWHKGRIWFDSQVNQGTTFYIELPKD